MSHHVSDLKAISEQMRRFANPELGATGQFPRGKLNAADEGEIKIGVAADVESQTVVINFGKSVALIGFDYDQAMALSDSIRDRAYKLRGISS